MHEIEAKAVLLFISKEKRGDPRKQISINDIIKATGFDDFRINQILKYWKEEKMVKYTEGIGWADGIDLTSGGWNYIWKNENVAKKLLKGTKLEKLLDFYEVANDILKK